MRISAGSSDVCSADLRVALRVPLAGTNAGVGQSIANATMMALLDSQSQRVRITNYDTSKGAAAAARQALADGNKLIIGPLLSENVKIVSPIARHAGVPVITFRSDEHTSETQSVMRIPSAVLIVNKT